MQLNGAEIVIECLKEQGVDTVFGYPGGAILNVYDELYKHRDEISTSLPPMNKGLLMRLTDMREQREKSASACYERTGGDESCYRNCNGIYGFNSYCGNHLQCRGITSWKRQFSGNRYSGNYNADYEI